MPFINAFLSGSGYTLGIFGMLVLIVVLGEALGGNK